MFKLIKSFVNIIWEMYYVVGTLTFKNIKNIFYIGKLIYFKYKRKKYMGGLKFWKLVKK